jgi:peptidoglycan/xylan/chitin deacetylase (PgdA/CDA1 family)
MMRILWPKGYRAALVIGIDDVHPESSQDRLDFGGDMEKGALGLLLNLINAHPYIKITLFITPNWQLKPQNVPFINFVKKNVQNRFVDKLTTPLVRKWRLDTFAIESAKYQAWCNFMREQVLSNKFSLGIHGYSHFNPTYFAQEFQSLSYEETEHRIENALKMFDSANLPVSKGFAPPGWSVTGNLLTALVKYNFKYIAGCVDHHSPVAQNIFSSQAGLQSISLYYPQVMLGGLVHIPRNYDISESDIERAEEIINIGGVIGIHGHIAKMPGINNPISTETINKLDKLLLYLEEKYNNEIWFTDFNEVSDYVI